MADPILHIKDSYDFEVPKPLYRVRNDEKSDFPDVWVKNDDQFQSWEAEHLYHGIEKLAGDDIHLPSEHDLIHHWEHWQHEGANHINVGRPLDVFLEMEHQQLREGYDVRLKAQPAEKKASYKFSDYLAEQDADHNHDAWIGRFFEKIGGEQSKAWIEARDHAGGKAALKEFKENTTDKALQWSPVKLDAYNDQLSGKILLYPQPFGELRNFYEAESGFCISKFMVIELVVSIILFTMFTLIASRARFGNAPKGRLWNLLEVFLLFIRDQVARPAIGAHHDEHEEAHPHSDPTGVKEGHGIGGAGVGGAPAEVDKLHHSDSHGHKPAKHAHVHHNPYAEADKFVPLLWTLFFFVLGCNLFGLVPWVGSPTAAWGVTLALAAVTFGTVVIVGMLKFGVGGFFLNQIPSMDLPWYMAIVLKPMIFAIEMGGLLIKHAVLSIRLLANMVAGHLVILGVLGLAFGALAAVNFESAPDWQWWLVATIAVVGSVLFNILELFVAFLQAYVFTFLSALFIGASVHKH